MFSNLVEFQFVLNVFASSIGTFKTKLPNSFDEIRKVSLSAS